MVYNTQYDVKIIPGYPFVKNDANTVSMVLETIEQFSDISTVECTPMMAGEDFSRYLQHIPGALFFIGCKYEKSSNKLHSAYYQINEKSLSIALKLFLSICSIY